MGRPTEGDELLLVCPDGRRSGLRKTENRGWWKLDGVRKVLYQIEESLYHANRIGLSVLRGCAYRGVVRDDDCRLCSLYHFVDPFPPLY